MTSLISRLPSEQGNWHGSAPAEVARYLVLTWIAGFSEPLGFASFKANHFGNLLDETAGVLFRVRDTKVNVT